MTTQWDIERKKSTLKDRKHIEFFHQPCDVAIEKQSTEKTIRMTAASGLPFSARPQVETDKKH